ncbi:MAG: aminotransferase class I/II-fold pyridoxal phosphate-dependent enzyme [Clostridiales bacterium]|nr:aminotransferase class I/II-fold pyridoxal phosphate-dependent enzyme [Clostridiales bacterium]
MSRGKPSAQQLALANDMLTILGPNDCVTENLTDARNYGGLDGIMEMKRIFGQMLNTPAESVVVGDNSSLTMMYHMIAACMFDGDEAWAKQGERVKFLCPAPGYDRHFAICQKFGIEMLPVPLNDDGPDMDIVEQIISRDAKIKGMWCVPVYSNPTGIVYSDEVCGRIAALQPAARDFRLFWDNAYCVHNFAEDRPQPFDILRLATNPDMPVLFTSFSKISFAGAAVAALAASEANRSKYLNHIKIMTVGCDKLNQLRHARYFNNLDGVLNHMQKMAAIVRPKFEATLDILSGLEDIADWTRPKGGYFISFNAKPGLAVKIVAECKRQGVIMTEAGATFPYGNDPLDKNIRIAPTYPSLDELTQAMKIFSRVARQESQKIVTRGLCT